MYGRNFLGRSRARSSVCHREWRHYWGKLTRDKSRNKSSLYFIIVTSTRLAEFSVLTDVQYPTDPWLRSRPPTRPLICERDSCRCIDVYGQWLKCMGGNAWERPSQAQKLCNAAFPGPIEGLFQWERTFLGPKIQPVIVPMSKIS